MLVQKRQQKTSLQFRGSVGHSESKRRKMRKESVRRHGNTWDTSTQTCWRNIILSEAKCILTWNRAVNYKAIMILKFHMLASTLQHVFITKTRFSTLFVELHRSVGVCVPSLSSSRSQWRRYSLRGRYHLSRGLPDETNALFWQMLKRSKNMPPGCHPLELFRNLQNIIEYQSFGPNSWPWYCKMPGSSCCAGCRPEAALSPHQFWYRVQPQIVRPSFHGSSDYHLSSPQLCQATISWW